VIESQNAKTITRTYVPLSVGFAAWYICSNWMGSFSYDVDAWWFSKSLCFFVGIPGALILCVATKRAPKSLLFGIDTVAASIQVTTIVCCSIVDMRHVPLAGAITSAFALATSWLMAQWSIRYARTSSADAAGAFVVSLVGISAVKLVVSLIGFECYSIIAAAAPLLSVTLLHAEIEHAPAEKAQYVYGADEIASLWPMAVSAAIFFLVWSWLNASLKLSTGHYSFGASADSELTVLSYLLLIAVSTFLYWWMVARSRRLDVSLVWRLAFVFIGIGLALSVSIGIIKPLQVVTGPTAVIGELLLWLTLVDIARQSTYQASAIVLLGMLLYVFPDAIARVLIGAFSASVNEQVVASYSLLAIILVVAFLLPQRSPDADRLLSGTMNEHPTKDVDNRINETCHAIAKQYGLSSREEDVLNLLCRGRSKPYIAETLFISENTVRSHVKRIYLKLDVHSKQELIDIVADEKRDV